MTGVVDTERQGPAPSPARRGRSSTLRTVLVHVRADAEDLARLRAAAALAHGFQATLYGVGCEQAPPLGAMDPTGLVQGAWYAEMEQQVRDNLERAHDVFQDQARGLETQWSAVQGMPAETLAQLSRAADIIVADARPAVRKDRYRAAGAVELMLFSGRPVLLAPPHGGSLKGAAVVVAWKDTREARRALADALPLLEAAETVLVLEICNEDEVRDAEARTAAVAAGLQRHGVAAHARATVAPPERVLNELDVAADALGADLVVAGGYGHTRLGEWVFGGVTRDLLHYCERFVLLSH
jgi:nucleotide-binding universal stress UspA family protein